MTTRVSICRNNYWRNRYYLVCRDSKSDGESRWYSWNPGKYPDSSGSFVVFPRFAKFSLRYCVYDEKQEIEASFLGSH